MGNDFFQSDMTTSVCTRLQSIQSDLKRKPFARIFCVLALTLLVAAEAFGITLKPRSADQFVEFQKVPVENQFWHKKTIWPSLEKERKIPVSVTKPKDGWSFKGAGLVQAPKSFCEEKAKDFNRLRQLPNHFPEVTFDAEKSVLSLKVKFLNRERDLILELFEDRTESESRIYFRSVGEWLKGAEGVFVFKDLGRQLTEVAILAQYQGSLSYVPDWLFRSTAEAVMHHVAESLRKSLETDYKK